MEAITQLIDGTYSVSLQGRFTFSDNPKFREIILDKIRGNEVKQIVLNMDKLEFVDSAALGMLLLGYDEAKEHHKSLSLQGVTGQVKRIFNMARFEQFFSY